MSFSIPQQIEKDIIAGRAKYQTFQTGNGGQSMLPVPPNSYVVIFGYDFSPAGGGLNVIEDRTISEAVLHPTAVRFFETQQISFYTGTDFYPFIHHVDVAISAYDNISETPFGTTQLVFSIDNKPLSRQVYITSTQDVAITHGLILNAITAGVGFIPVTSRTPGFLTYGGTAQPVQVQTNYGPAGTPLQFMQPSPKDFQDFNIGILPGNPNDQAFATPDVTNGLVEANLVLSGFGPNFTTAAATNYYLCMHYAIYSAAIPEQRG